MISQLLKKIIDDNNRFVEKHNDGYFSPHMTSQHPQITLVSCSDSRVQPHVLLDDPIDQIFTVENIGNQITSAQGSVDYGVLHLHTPILLVLGHSDCGDIKAFMKGYDGEPEAIKNEIDTLKGAVLPFDNKGSFEEEVLGNVQRNVDYQVDIAAKRYEILIDKGSLTVIGAIYDFLNTFARGHGRVVITNINGIKEPERMRDMPFIKGMRDQISIARLV
ncbi:MAG: carbonic anhydrase [Deltaproteobacteria bacterium]|nr:carbonic anhydrase [Deltaproteobacteria bacterium]